MINKLYIFNGTDPDLDKTCKKINEMINILNENARFREYQNNRILLLERRIQALEKANERRRYE